MPTSTLSCNILGDCQQIIAATESQLDIRSGSLDSSNPTDFVMFCMPWIHVWGRRQTTWAAFAYTGDRTAFSRKATAA
jgi:hypothetical protein